MCACVSMEEQSILIEYLGNSPKLRIMDFLIENMPFDYSKKEIIEGAGMGKVTFFKIWKDILKLGIVIPTRKYGKAQLYTLNKEDPRVKILLKLEFELGKLVMEEAMKKEKIPIEA